MDIFTLAKCVIAPEIHVYLNGLGCGCCFISHFLISRHKLFLSIYLHCFPLYLNHHLICFS